MKTRTGLAAGVAALLLCSCVPQAEYDRVRAEADRARAEADAMREKAEAEEKGKAATVKQKEAQEKALPEVMKRWNASAGGVAAQAPGFGPVNFAWKDADKFPHPTFKGGSAEAYGAFAAALLAFLQDKENFAFLATNKLFDAELRYGLANGKGATWTFAQLAEQLAKPDAHGNHDADTRKALKALAEKMKAPPKG